MSIPKIFANGKQVDLNQNHYKGAGGEGTIYVKGGKAYKIYHDPSKAIPPEKIRELATIDLPNVLGPIAEITDAHGRAIGFAMRYVDKTEYLCRLFTKGFRESNSVDTQTINALVKRMQDTLHAIHQKDILVVDYNELNFLTSTAFDEIYHIDVDCYQTPHYPATAIMESIRDRKVKAHKWTRESDWFSFGVVAFQLYMSTHPYKGRHPDFGKDWQKMMEAGVSVFNKATRLPPNTQDWAVIPKGHLKWFEKIFEHGERIAPPSSPDAATDILGPVKTQIIASTEHFEIKTVRTYKSEILALRYINGTCYAWTKDAIQADQKEIKAVSPTSGYTARRTQKDICPAQNDAPVLINFNTLTNKLTYESLDGKLQGESETTGFFIAQGRLYAVTPKGLIEYSFMNLGAKTIASQQAVAQIFHQHIVVDGMVIQDMLGTCHLAFPTSQGCAANIRVKELDGLRILSAKYQRGFAILLAEKGGTFSRFTLVFDKSHRYSLREEANAPLQEIEFTVLDKGSCVATNEANIEIFLNNDTVKVVEDSPLTGSQKLLSSGNQVLMTNKNQLLQISVKA